MAKRAGAEARVELNEAASMATARSLVTSEGVPELFN
jgi:hypothetical protein